MITRPLTKDVLKRMFLKTLWEHKRPGGSLTGHSWGVDSIISTTGSTLAFLFKIPNINEGVRAEWSLTKEERELALQGVEELQRDGYIMNDPDQSNSVFKKLTEKGKQYAEKELEHMVLPTVDIEEVLS